MKPAALFITSLLLAQPFAAMADSADQGPITLTMSELDGVSAGALPLSAIAAASAATGSFTVTGTDTLVQVLGHSLSAPQFGTAQGFVVATGGTATATSSGDSASQSTAIGTSDDPTPAPFAATIDKTVNILGTQIQVYSSVVPGGIMVDWFAYQLGVL